MFGGSWIIEPAPVGKACVVLVDPKTDRLCGKPATTGRTVLDLPICDACYQAVATIEGIQRAA